MQVCPDCHREWSDDSNYCEMCQAKLPNAKEWVTDHKKMRESMKKGDKEVSKTLHECLGDEKFRSRLFFLLLARACERTDPPFTCERYIRDEIFALVVLEALREEKG
jgi:hypothetical protein